MVAVLTNFVTLNQKINSVLSPGDYRNMVLGLQSILKNYQFTELNGRLADLVSHIRDFKDPHHDHKIDFYDVIVEKTYNIYKLMLANPLSLADFKVQIVPTLGFVELFRRILLNRFLYDQVKRFYGNVPEKANVFLTREWDVDPDQNPIELTFGTGITSEADFLKLGWTGNTSPIEAIFNADFLTPPSQIIKATFETTSTEPAGETYLGLKNYPIPLQFQSNDMTIRLKVTGSPTVTETLLSLRSSRDKVDLTMTPAGIVTLLLNGAVWCQSASPSVDGIIEVVLTSRFYTSLKTNTKTAVQNAVSLFKLAQENPFMVAIVGVNHENPFTNDFGIQSLTVFNGYIDTLPDINVLLPIGYSVLTDPDGKVLVDPDGTVLIDYDLTVPENYTMLVDADGSYLLDDDNTFLAEETA